MRRIVSVRCVQDAVPEAETQGVGDLTRNLAAKSFQIPPTVDREQTTLFESEDLRETLSLSYILGRGLGPIFASRGSCVGKFFGGPAFVWENAETCAAPYKP
jgi:hypothetical protein